jgi:6-pyruvoyltetrahydropterin/6-carboxytetrahydropterin synthase
MLITKKFRFEAAHNLVNYQGNCERLHGHSYKLEVTLKGNVGANGFIKDFKEIEKEVDERVIKLIDHSYLNDVVKISTCENLIKWIWEKIKDLEPHEIRLYETNDSWVTYNGRE